MLKKSYRLPVGHTLSHPRMCKTSFCSIKYAQSGSIQTRYGFIIGKKVDKRAVVRNRTKRIVRSYTEHRLTSFKKGYDILFILHKDVEDMPYEVLERELDEVFKKEDLVI